MPANSYDGDIIATYLLRLVFAIELVALVHDGQFLSTSFVKDPFPRYNTAGYYSEPDFAPGYRGKLEDAVVQNSAPVVSYDIIGYFEARVKIEASLQDLIGFSA